MAMPETVVAIDAPRTSLWDVCGNRLVACAEPASDGELRSEAASRTRAAYCFDGAQRMADGVVCFAPRSGYVRTAFSNPDGSFERLCGNSLFLAAALFENAIVRAFDASDRIVQAAAGTYRTRGCVSLASDYVGTPWGTARVLDTGSPHAVVRVADVERIDLGADAARSFVRELDLNLTVWSARRERHLIARTLERGVFAETASCGTGALAVALCAARWAEPLDIRYPGGRYIALVEPNAARSFGEFALSVPRKAVTRLTRPAALPVRYIIATGYIPPKSDDSFVSSTAAPTIDRSPKSARAHGGVLRSRRRSG